MEATAGVAAAQPKSSTKEVTAASTNTVAADDGFWHDLRLPEKFGEILKIGTKVDCTFIVGPTEGEHQTIFAHKWMFAIESPVFERMFCGDFRESKDDTLVHLPEDDPTAFRNLRSILYNTSRNQLKELDLEDTIDMYELCEKYMIASIKKQCLEHIRSFYDDITESQLIRLFSVCLALQNFNMLTEVKEKLKHKNYPLIEDLNYLDAKKFIEYLELHLANAVGNANHLQLFNTIEGYLKYHELIELDTKDPEDTFVALTLTVTKDSIAHSELLERLLAYVDFGKIAIAEFLAGPGVSKILTWQQKYFVISQLAAQDTNKDENLTIKLFHAK